MSEKISLDSSEISHLRVKMDFVNIGMKIMAIFATCDTFLTD